MRRGRGASATSYAPELWVDSAKQCFFAEVGAKLRGAGQRPFREALVGGPKAGNFVGLTLQQATNKQLVTTHHGRGGSRAAPTSESQQQLASQDPAVKSHTQVQSYAVQGL